MQQTLADLCAARGWSFDGAVIVVALDDGRTQKLTVTEYAGDGHRKLRFVSKVGDANSLDAQRLRAALGLNLNMPFGCFAIDDNDLVVVETLFVERTSDAELGATIVAIASTADRYERLLFRSDAH
jgi:hypothetical protein